MRNSYTVIVNKFEWTTWPYMGGGGMLLKMILEKQYVNLWAVGWIQLTHGGVSLQVIVETVTNRPFPRKQNIS
jgi:hypothetical protein